MNVDAATGGGFSPDVVFQAMRPSAAGPEPPPGSGAERVLSARYCLIVTPMPTLNFVEPLDLPPSEATDAVAEVRALLRARDRHQAAWFVDTSPPDLHEQLIAFGMTPYTDAPLEPRSTCMALTRRPTGTTSPEIVVRQAVDRDDFVAVGKMSATVFGVTGADRDGLIEGMLARFELQKQGLTKMSTYLALIDGELVGEAQALVMPSGINLSGSSVLPAARGRGVYRALVSARWDEAMERDLSALTVQAGAMSAPILQRLGFETVGTQLVLCDRFD